MHRFALFAALCCVAGGGLAAPESYTIDSRHTFPRWAVSHHGFSIHQGQFNKTAGKLVVDWAARTGAVEIEVDSASVGTGDPEFDKVLRGQPFFDTDRHPKITFKGTAMRFEKEVPVSVTGDLMLLGVTRPVTFAVSGVKCGVHPVSKKALCGAGITGDIKRSEFGMKAGLPSVGDDIRLTIQFEAFKD